MVGFSSILFVRGCGHRGENFAARFAGFFFVFRPGGGKENKIVFLFGRESRGRDCDRSAIAEAFSSFRPDRVMHLAAESHVDRSITGAAARPSSWVEVWTGARVPI